MKRFSDLTPEQKKQAMKSGLLHVARSLVKRHFATAKDAELVFANEIDLFYKEGACYCYECTDKFMGQILSISPIIREDMMLRVMKVCENAFYPDQDDTILALDSSV